MSALRSASPRTDKFVTALAWIGAGIALASALVAASSGVGYQKGLWDYRTGFAILRWSAYAAVGVSVVTLVAFALAALRRAGAQVVVSLAGLGMALVLVLPAWDLQRTVNQVPRIHDITTDTENPPQFVALREVRLQAPNRAEYGGAKIAEAQKAAYPDIKPVVLVDVPPPAAFERALNVARSMGWEIVAAEREQGRIEATATTFWFRFKDDVAIRIVADGTTGSRLDIRSMSRVGISDLGTNAKRIREFVKKYQAGSS